MFSVDGSMDVDIDTGIDNRYTLIISLESETTVGVQ